MEFSRSDIEPGSSGSVLIPAYINDPKSVAAMDILEAFPHGELGYMIAEDRARREGKLDEFHKRINELADKIIKTKSDNAEAISC